MLVIMLNMVLSCIHSDRVTTEVELSTFDVFFPLNLKPDEISYFFSVKMYDTQSGYGVILEQCMFFGMFAIFYHFKVVWSIVVRRNAIVPHAIYEFNGGRVSFLLKKKIKY